METGRQIPWEIRIRGPMVPEEKPKFKTERVLGTILRDWEKPDADRQAAEKNRVQDIRGFEARRENLPRI